MNSTLRWPCYDGRVAIRDLRNSVGSATRSQSATAKDVLEATAAGDRAARTVLGDTVCQPDRGSKRE